MSSIGPQLPGTGAVDTSFGGMTWTFPPRITASDSLGTYMGTSDGNSSYYIKGTGYNFSGIDDSATIEGVEVVVRRYATANALRYTVDGRIRLVVGGTIGTTDRADTSTHWATSWETKTYGGASDLWGESLTPSIVKASNFGAVLAATCYGSINNISYVDYIGITVYYSLPSAGQPLQLRGILVPGLRQWQPGRH